MKKILIPFLFLSPLFSLAQKPMTEYFDKDWKRTDKTHASYYREVTYDENGDAVGMVRDYYLSGKLQFEGQFTAVYEDRMSGECKWYYENGKLQKTEHYNKEGFADGKMLEYYENGQLSLDASWYPNYGYDGPYTEYYPNGKKKLQGEFYRGKKTGTHTYWRENGEIQYIDQYQDPEHVIPLSLYWTSDKKMHLFHTSMGIGYALYNLHWYLKSGLREISDDSLMFYFNDENYKHAFKLVELKEGRNSITDPEDSGKIELVIKGGQLNGTYTEYFPKGEKKTEGTYRDNLREGTWKEWNKNNILYKESNYKAGKLDGEQKKFLYNSGQLEESSHYANGKLNGKKEYVHFEMVMYRDQPEFYAVEDWRNDSLVSGKYYYVDTLTLKPKNMMAENMMLMYSPDSVSGTVKMYYENGQLQQQAVFVKGKPLGMETHYYRDGKKQQEIVHVDRQNYKMINAWDSSGKQVVMNGNGTVSQPYGNWKKVSYYRDSLLSVEQDFTEDGSLVSVDSMWYPQRKFELKETHKYTFDKGRKFRMIYTPTGNSTTGWYANGNKMQERSSCYHRGLDRECGTYTTWYENGKMQEQGSYVHGRKNGSWKYWDESGKLVREEVYNMGDLVK